MRARILGTAIATAVFALAITAPAGHAGLISDLGAKLNGGGSGGELTLGGKRCKLIRVPAAAPIGTTQCPGVRPGSVVQSERGQCSFNFLFEGSGGTRYMGTAGHCILGESAFGGEDAGEETWAPGSGPEALDENMSRIGEFAYAILEDERDFALVRLDPGVDASAAMCHFGGPTYTNDSNPPALPPTELNHYGAGILIGDVLPARTMLALGMPDPDHVFAEGVAVPGDSGSGVMSSDGGAVGVFVTAGVHLGSIGTEGLDVGLLGVTRLTPQLNGAEEALGTNLTLQTAPLQ